MTSQQEHDIASILINWFHKNQRLLPWRTDYTPYQVWISEMMLQQTQMERGVQYFLRWMERFPNVQSVAEAPESDILQAWEGLGYYSRARNLHAAAKKIVSQYGAEIPDDFAKLRSLPGIGDYTAAAILGIAFQKDVVTVDANVERIFARIYNLDIPRPTSQAREIALRMLPQGQARFFNQAMMEFGALICNKTPNCIKSPLNQSQKKLQTQQLCLLPPTNSKFLDTQPPTVCPLRDYCESFRAGIVELRPVLPPKAEIIPVYACFAVIQNNNGEILVHQRPKTGLWAGLWEFPGLETTFLPTKKEPDLLHSYLAQLLQIPLEYRNFLITIKHSYTNHRLTAAFYQYTGASAQAPTAICDFPCVNDEKYRWVSPAEPITMPAHHRKAFHAVFGKSQ